MTKSLQFWASVEALPEELIARLQGIVREKILARKEYLLKAGRICRHLYFVRKGLLRCYYFNGSKEISSWFLKEGDVCTDVESFFEQQYGNENIQALEDSVVEYISYEQLEAIYRDFPTFNRCGRLLMQNFFLMNYHRTKDLWMRNAHDRYQWFQENFPDLSGRIPAKYLSSYLGMTATMLSRLKKKDNN